MARTDEIVSAIEEALAAPIESRLLETERGYQGSFYVSLRSALARRKLLNDGFVLEMEYQKTVRRHRLRQRPDIVLHRPTQAGGNVTAANLVVFALKRHATRRTALADFEKLDDMCALLSYELAVFINIDSQTTFREFYAGNFGDRLLTFSVQHRSGRVYIRRD